VAARRRARGGRRYRVDRELDDWRCSFVGDQEVILETKHGTPFSPCQPLRHDRVRDMKMVCPCIPFRAHRTRLEAGWVEIALVWALQGGLPKRAV